jgi:hypothetical protein
MSRSFVLAACAAAGVCILPGGSSAWAVVTASSVMDYQQGGATSFTNPTAALGLPAGDTTFGALTPFNPPFKDDQIVIVGAGGSITLRLSEPVPAGGAGPEVGVFSNNGLIDVSAGGTGTAGTPAATFSPPSVARVSVSADGKTFVPLGAEPLTFANPTNFYTDVIINDYSAPLGNSVADLSRPFTGTLSDFDGLTYPQMVRLLAGSGGGTWIDVSGPGLGTVRYVRFDVPAGATQRLVLDAVTAIPEPMLGLLVLPILTLMRRRRFPTP